jgi:hypothetical protein
VGQISGKVQALHSLHCRLFRSASPAR